MTRKYLVWSDLRPNLLRAVGRSGVEYRIEQTDRGNWMLTHFATPSDPGMHITCGYLADMKALAEEYEADALDPAPAPQRIAWTRLGAGHYWGVAPCGLAYRIRKLGRTWTLEEFPIPDAERGTPIDDGALPTMKRCAEQHATAAATERATEEVA